MATTVQMLDEILEFLYTTQQLTLEDISDTLLEFYAKYTNNPKLTKEQLIDKACSLRRKALKVYDYRCIRTFRFLRLTVTEHPTYQKVIRPKLQDKKIPWIY